MWAWACSYIRVHFQDSTRQAALDVMHGIPLPPPDPLNILADEAASVVPSPPLYPNYPSLTVMAPYEAELRFASAICDISRLVCFSFLFVFVLLYKTYVAYS